MQFLNSGERRKAQAGQVVADAGGRLADAGLHLDRVLLHLGLEGVGPVAGNEVAGAAAQLAATDCGAQVAGMFMNFLRCARRVPRIALPGGVSKIGLRLVSFGSRTFGEMN